MKYYIPKFYLDKLEKLVKSLQKKTNVEFKVYEDDIKLETFIDHMSPEHKRYKYLTIGIELNIDYKVGDYEIVAELEHHSIGNIIRQINMDYEVPNQYKTCEPICEHCNKIRNRANTFLLVDKNNNFKQVGKTCLNDYTGIDTLSILNKVSSITFLLGNNLENDDEFKEYLFNYSPKYEPLDYMANLFYQIVLNEGYSKNNENPFKHYEDYQYRKDLEPKVEELLNVVNTNWYNENSNYCHNVKVMLGLEFIEYRHWRLLLSYINSAMTYLGNQFILNNEYLGNIGDKIEFDVRSIKLLYSKRVDIGYNRWTSTGVYRIITTTNQVVIWNSSNDIPDNVKHIKATIKKLTEYKGEKQTVITRGTFTQEEPTNDDSENASVGFNNFLNLVNSEEFDWDKFKNELEERR